MAKFGSFAKGYLDQKNKRLEREETSLYKNALMAKLAGDLEDQSFKRGMQQQAFGAIQQPDQGDDSAVLKKIQELEAELQSTEESQSAPAPQQAPAMAEPSDEFKLKANAILKKYGMGGI